MLVSFKEKTNLTQVTGQRVAETKLTKRQVSNLDFDVDLDLRCILYLHLCFRFVGVASDCDVVLLSTAVDSYEKLEGFGTKWNQGRNQAVCYSPATKVLSAPAPKFFQQVLLTDRFGAKIFSACPCRSVPYASWRQNGFRREQTYNTISHLLAPGNHSAAQNPLGFYGGEGGSEQRSPLQIHSEMLR